MLQCCYCCEIQIQSLKCSYKSIVELFHLDKSLDLFSILKSIVLWLQFLDHDAFWKQWGTEGEEMGYLETRPRPWQHLTFLVDKRPSNNSSLHHVPPQVLYQKSMENWAPVFSYLAFASGVCQTLCCQCYELFPFSLFCNESTTFSDFFIQS